MRELGAALNAAAAEAPNDTDAETLQARLTAWMCHGGEVSSRTMGGRLSFRLIQPRSWPFRRDPKPSPHRRPAVHERR
jgi:hypothetical protein